MLKTNINQYKVMNNEVLYSAIARIFNTTSK